MSHPFLAVASRLSMRLHGERALARVEPATGPAYDVPVSFDRASQVRNALSLALTDAAPTLWVHQDDDRGILENRDIIVLRGERWKASSRFPREDGLVEYALYQAPP